MNVPYKKLIKAACDVRKHAYCPYSRLKVGAAVFARSGAVYTGANVENASYGLTLCAERAAFAKAVAEGERKFKAIAVVFDDKKPGVPCGACRQVIYEFGSDIEVIMAAADGTYTVKKISDLLPLAFGPEHL